MKLINRLQPGREAVDEDRGIIINAAAYTFTSLAILDALKMFEGPIIELHISDTHRWEGMYRHSLVSKAVTGVIAGLGAKGYPAAADRIRRIMGAFRLRVGARAGGVVVIRPPLPRERSQLASGREHSELRCPGAGRALPVDPHG